jgi:hypothetical protein
MRRYPRSASKALYMFMIAAMLAFTLVPTSAIASKYWKEPTVNEPSPVVPAVTTQCTKNHTDNATPKLRKCWEAPVLIQVVFIEDDGVHRKVTHPANVSVTIHNDGKNWSDPTVLQWNNNRIRQPLYTNDDGRVTTDGGFMRVPNPELNNKWLQNVTWNITVNFVYNLTLRDMGSQQINLTQDKNITIPNNESETLSTNYSRWFVFQYKWTMLSHRTEVVDDHWEAGAGIVGFIIIGAVPTVLHFQRKKEVEETKRKEKESRFKI